MGAAAQQVTQKRIPKVVKSGNQRWWKLPRGPADATRQKPKKKVTLACLQEQWLSMGDGDKGDF